MARYWLNFAVDRLWGLHLQEAAWEYHLLSMEFGRKVWSVQKSYAGDMNAIEDAMFDAVQDLGNTGCLTPSVGDGHICQDRWSAVDSEVSRRVAGVCYRSNDQVAPYVAQITARVQAIAEHLKETHSRLVEDFRRAVARIGQDKSGAKADIFAPADQFLEKSKIIATENGAISFTPKNFAVRMYVPFSGGAGYNAGSGFYPDPRPCLDWSKQMPTRRVPTPRSARKLPFGKPAEAGLTLSSAHLTLGEQKW